MSLEKIMQLSGGSGEPPDLDADLLLAVQAASRELVLLLASDDADDGKKDDGDDEGGGHASHATFKALRKRDVPPDRASAMCAKSDKNVKATQLARSLSVMLSGRPGIDTTLVTLTPESDPVGDKRHLHSAAVLAASGHGNVPAASAMIRKRARELGVDVKSLPGFGGSDDDHERAAASMVALAAKAAGDGGVPMNHGPFTGTHTHSHFQSSAHAHPHQHVNDSTHDGGPLHRPGSKPQRGW